MEVAPRYILLTLWLVYIVDVVYKVDMVYTVDMVNTVYTVYYSNCFTLLKQSTVAGMPIYEYC